MLHLHLYSAYIVDFHVNLILIMILIVLSMKHTEMLCIKQDGILLSLQRSSVCPHPYNPLIEM
jgi:hypothetical protein